MGKAGFARPHSFLFVLFVSLWWAPLCLAQDLPPPPSRYFDDRAGFLSAADARRLDEKLARFDRETSSQVVVAIFPELPSPSLEDFTVRTAQAWRAGRSKLDNGVVLFVFVQDRKLRLEVGYGLEAALPDALAKRIVDDEIAPRLRSGDRAAALEAGIDAILAATRGEYQARPAQRGSPGASPAMIVLIVLAFALVFWLQGGVGPTIYTGGGWHRRRRYGGWSHHGGWGGGFGRGGFGGGGFSGGGGRFGGGGASGSW